MAPVDPTTSNWWYHTDLATKKRWFGEPFGGPDTEIARPFYVATLEKKLRDSGFSLPKEFKP